MGIELSPDLYPLHDTDEVFDSTREQGSGACSRGPNWGARAPYPSLVTNGHLQYKAPTKQHVLCAHHFAEPSSI